MGNRGTVIFTDGKGEYSPAVYLHWNGGPESVYGFLEELNRRHARGADDLPYQTARFIQLVGEFFDIDKQGNCSLDVVAPPTSDDPRELAKVQTDLGDHGIYMVLREGDHFTIRRFREDYENNIMIEMSPEAVLSERRAAYKHKYGLLKQEFTKIANGREVEAK